LIGADLHLEGHKALAVGAHLGPARHTQSHAKHRDKTQSAATTIDSDIAGSTALKGCKHNKKKISVPSTQQPVSLPCQASAEDPESSTRRPKRRKHGKENGPSAGPPVPESLATPEKVSKKKRKRNDEELARQEEEGAEPAPAHEVRHILDKSRGGSVSGARDQFQDKDGAISKKVRQENAKGQPERPGIEPLQSSTTASTGGCEPSGNNGQGFRTTGREEPAALGMPKIAWPSGQEAARKKRGRFSDSECNTIIESLKVNEGSRLHDGVCFWSLFSGAGPHFSLGWWCSFYLHVNVFLFPCHTAAPFCCTEI
jgi:hypothetical protein